MRRRAALLAGVLLLGTLKKQEVASSSLAAKEHDASDFLEAFRGLSDGSFADGVDITAAAINVHRELLHVESLIAAGRAEDPHGHYTDLLAKQGQAMTDLEDRLRAVVREIGRLPFAPSSASSTGSRRTRLLLRCRASGRPWLSRTVSATSLCTSCVPRPRCI
jgi:hypothetical protein